MSTGGAAAEYIKGVPHALPAGEHVLWQGAPHARAVARHVFHQRGVAIYFAVMLVMWVVGTTDALTSSAFASGFALRMALVVLVLGVLEMLARVVARTTVYAITDRRVVLRIGMVIPMSINIPFALLTSADVGQFRDGTGQLSLSLEKGHRIAYIALWPHCRVFRFNQPSPVLRGLLDPSAVGELLANAVSKAAAESEASEGASVATGDASSARATARQPDALVMA
jgi:hypothetical protein